MAPMVMKNSLRLVGLTLTAPTYPTKDTGLASPNAGTPANLTGLYQVFWINTAEYSNIELAAGYRQYRWH